MSFLLLQLSNSFIRILAVPNNAVFCNSPVLIVTTSFSSHASNLLLTIIIIIIIIINIIIIIKTYEATRVASTLTKIIKKIPIDL